MKPSKEVTRQYLSILHRHREDLVEKDLPHALKSLSFPDSVFFDPEHIRTMRIRIWGIKDGRRIYIDQQGPHRYLEPEIPELRQAERLLPSALAYVDELVDLWLGSWLSDEELQARASEQNLRKRQEDPPIRMSADEYRRWLGRFLASATGPSPSMFLSSAEIRELNRRVSMPDEQAQALADDLYEKQLASHKEVITPESLRAKEEDGLVKENLCPPYSWESIQNCLGMSPSIDSSPPKNVLKCRECLQPCRWTWHQFFADPTCGSAGWVAICERCQSWHRECNGYVI